MSSIKSGFLIFPVIFTPPLPFPHNLYLDQRRWKLGSDLQRNFKSFKVFGFWKCRYSYSLFAKLYANLSKGRIVEQSFLIYGEFMWGFLETFTQDIS